jgi:hypothetical protein
MVKRLLTSILLFISLIAYSQEKVIYDENVQKRTVESFQAIKVADGIDLYITQGEEDGVAVSASEIAQRDKIKTVVENGELRIYLDGSIMNWNWKNRKLTAYVSVKTLQKLRASGGSDVIIKGELKSDNLNIVLNGGSDLSGQVVAKDLTIDQNGGSDVRITGSAVNIKIDAGGGSDFKGSGFTAEYAIIQAGGGSDAHITVTKEIAAEANGGSDIHYKGNPVIKYKAAAGGGSVSKGR